MRYGNWDVLLFPELSRVPIQEFKTQCFVAKDVDSPNLHRTAYQSPHSYYPGSDHCNQLPVLTTFIPSLPVDNRFRISVHSWEKPRPSLSIEAHMEPEDVLLFEARVYVDGDFIAGAIFGQRTDWPHIIELTNQLDRDGNPDMMRFPPFHSEVLGQKYWDINDMKGRIRVVIAEGFSRPNRSPPFERYKDVVAMSFQHAPLNVLEFSSIAWPNPKMWLPSGNVPRYFPGNGYGNTKRPGDPHGHSPSKPNCNTVNSSSQSSNSNVATFNCSHQPVHPSSYAWTPHRGFPIPSTQWTDYPRGPRWEGQNTYAEPALDNFVDDTAWRSRGARSSREDIPMPDYASSSTSSRAISSMTDISYEHSKQPSMTAAMDEDQYNELIQALTPTKLPTVGTRAPSNTPSSIVPANKPSAAAQARSDSYSRVTRRTSALCQISQPSTRDVSGSSMPPVTEKDAAELPASKVRASPSEKIKSKKKVVKDVDAVTSQDTTKEKDIMKKVKIAIDAERALANQENEESIT
ncbi:uncharacterized protein N7511_007268 [Penicillium nucicola]|uniref:uncharacterized protein n=1 Tax=Penicillium nucicola TaxID=1850975 RepID=UPI002544D761|nr:uncharacterized protein N7511_007268 [Penicillium nucicola]KAJ5757086.1 hypothetical protein N7511_007268 [Penicillium nucicola]